MAGIHYGRMTGTAFRDGVYLADVTDVDVKLRPVADTREYPSVPVVELAPEPIPVWAVVMLTLAITVNAILWPLAAILIWEHWH